MPYTSLHFAVLTVSGPISKYMVLSKITLLFWTWKWQRNYACTICSMMNYKQMVKGHFLAFYFKSGFQCNVHCLNNNKLGRSVQFFIFCILDSMFERSCATKVQVKPGALCWWRQLELLKWLQILLESKCPAVVDTLSAHPCSYVLWSPLCWLFPFSWHSTRSPIPPFNHKPVFPLCVCNRGQVAAG